MLIAKNVRKAVYKYLFTEGVATAEKDYTCNHPEITYGDAKSGEAKPVKNVVVIKLLQSLRSRELVTERYAWRHYYYFLTDAGIAYLREYLNIPEDVIPNTLVKVNRPMERRPEGARDGPRRGGDRDGPRRDRDGYRGGAGAGAPANKEQAPVNFQPSYGQ